MNKIKRNIIPCLLFSVLALQFSGGVEAQEQIHLFPDKSYAVSGDTIWFGVFIYTEGQGDTSRVVHVQLDNASGNHILKVSVLCHGAFGEGYIPVPDSLSTGIYTLSPFSLVQKNSGTAIINQTFINVYNRFSAGISTIRQPDETLFRKYSPENGIKIKTDKERYNRGEEVRCSFDIPQNELDDVQKVFITAGVSDPVSEQYLSSDTPVQTSSNTKTPVALQEKNGVLITGKVTDKSSGAPVANAIVVLSIPDSVSSVNYSVSDENGMFRFHLKKAVAKADLILKALNKNNQECNIELADTQTPVKLTEKDGVLISGEVTDKSSGDPVSKAIVLLSIPDSIPFFDYCVSDENGMFYFYLRNAVGKADLIFQTLNKNNQECTVKLADNYIEVQKEKTSEKILTVKDEEFVGDILKASYFDKLFNGYNIVSPDYFSKPKQFEYPFYGKPTETYYPALFIDLPDFQEISREILHGVMYRERKGEITIRLVDYGTRTIFEDEPLRLLDGIPVFDNQVFKPLETADIRKVDVILYERFYGDLSFQGVLSVYTKNRSLDWVDSDPKIAHFKYACLQLPKNSAFKNRKNTNANIPDFNKVLYRNSPDDFKSNNAFDFFTSDIKGDVEIRLVIIDKNNRIRYCQKLIKVE